MKLNGKSINYNVQTVDELVSLDGLEGDTVVVTDENRGGVFVYREDNVGTNNEGTIFNGWTRQYDGAVNVKWFGAVGDGVTDDTSAIQASINSSLNIDISNGVFAVKRGFLLSKDYTKIRGNGSLMFHPDYDTDDDTVGTGEIRNLNFFTVDANYVEFSGLYFNMKRPTLISEPGIYGGGSYGVRFRTGASIGSIHNCTFVNQELLSLASVTGGSGSDRITIDSCVFYATSVSDGGGAILLSGTNSIATNNIITNLGDSYISLDDSYGSIASNNIMRNTLISSGTSLRAVGTMLQVAHGSKNCIVEGNAIEGVTVCGILLFSDYAAQFNENNLITNNNIYIGSHTATNAVIAMKVDSRSRGNVFKGNIVTSSIVVSNTSFMIWANAYDTIIESNKLVHKGSGADFFGIFIQCVYDSNFNGILIRNNKLKGTGIAVSTETYSYGDSKIVIESNNITGYGQGLNLVNEVNYNIKYHIQDNTFEGVNSPVSGGTRFNAYFNSYNSAERAMTKINSAQSVVWGPSYPDSGTWRATDIVYNIYQSSNTYIGWTCTSPGTPGTWRGFGATVAL